MLAKSHSSEQKKKKSSPLQEASMLAVASEPQWGPLSGKLVEVSGIEDASQADVAEGVVDTTGLNGAQGRVLRYVTKDRCRVQTFDGVLADVAPTKLLELEPLEPEEGGFDVLWPDASSGSMGHGIFASMVAECLVTKGYCVVQLSHKKSVRDEAVEFLSGLGGEQLLPVGFEQEYIGSDSKEKVAWWPYFRTEVSADFGLEQTNFNLFESFGTIEGLESHWQCDRLMTNLGMLLWPLAPEFPAERRPFVSWGRTNPMVRMTLASKEEKKMLIQQQREFDEGDMEKHTKFMDQKRLCMMQFLEVSGGSLILTPQGKAEFADVNVPVKPNRLIIFRCDDFIETYMPKGRSVVLQCWILAEPQEMRLKELQQREVVGPNEPDGERTHVLSIATRYSANSFDPRAMSHMFVGGSDGEIEVPLSRWDIEDYYSAEHTIGCSMTKHSSLLDALTIMSWDPGFFNIPPQEANAVAPQQRLCLEVGYEALASAGFSRPDLYGRHVGVFLGETPSDDWDALCFDRVSPERYAGKVTAVTCARLSHIMGLRGPISTTETACSSSLVATGVAQSSMRTKQEDLRQNVLNISTGLTESLVIGLNTLLGPGNYIALSGPRMLTQKGRCFTFDESADGYARGEGLGSIFLRLSADPSEAVGRWGVLVGTCVSQDGRSASLTAPHGPSQQQCILASMGEGGYTINEVSIAECHGTGTSLGDPIEVGAIRKTMAKRGETPIMLTSSKSNIGHGEASAGMAGLIKCLLMLSAQGGMPNIHLRHINPHIDVAGFPVYFDTELQDFGTQSGVSGVSSFGFGGTNARADLWGNAHYGPHACVTGVMERQLQLIF